MEIELHLIDNKGKICPRAAELQKEVLRRNKNLPIVKECGKQLIEFGCYPGVETYSPALDMIHSLEETYAEAEKLGLAFYPFATYPGKYKPKFNKGYRYDLKKKILGEERFTKAAKCAGFHHHYTLPKGCFDTNVEYLRLLMDSKLMRSMISSYNFEVAIDPVLTLFAQSSPFFEGKILAKDSRQVVYRGGSKLKYPDGVYGGMQQIGGLPPYKQTGTDLMHSLRRRQIRWKKHVKTADPKSKFEELYPNPLDIGWNPVKVNKHGTLEQRGMDVNYTSVLFSISTLLKFCLERIQQEFIEVLPADVGMNESFKVENGIMYIPPHTHVRNNLQLWSAYEGYTNKDLYDYTKRLFNFGTMNMPKPYKRIIRPLAHMVENKQSMSDMILKYAKKKGYIVDAGINQSDSAELALHYSEHYMKDLEQSRTVLEKIKSGL